MLLAFGMWIRSQGSARPTPLALPPSPLVDRLWPLLSACERIRSAAATLTAEDLLLCAPPGARLEHHGGDLGASMVGVEWHLPVRGGDGIGPGRRLFLDLHRALADVDEDDRRLLAETGFDLRRLVSALEPVGEATAWRRHLLIELETLGKAVAQVRHDPYR